jgi:phage terminase large subunit
LKPLGAFPRIFFNADTTEADRDVIGWYHESDRTMIGISGSGRTTIGARGADALGLVCIHYDQPDGAPPQRERYRGRRSAGSEGSWQSAWP